MKRLLAIALLGIALTAHGTVVTKEVTYKDGDTTLTSYLAYDDAAKGKQPGVLLVPEFWGLNAFVKDYARFLASQGYTALAVDPYGKVAPDRKTATELMGTVMSNPEVMKARFHAARKALEAQPTVDPKRIGAVGFSMGGRMVLSMARTGEDLAGVVSVYGNLETKEPAKSGATKARILVINAESDPYVKAESIPAFKTEMESAKVNYRLVNYHGVKHGFANPEATENGKKFEMPIAYDADADKKARAEIAQFFSEVFKK